MENLKNYLEIMNTLLWKPFIILLVVSTGLFLMCILKWMPLFKIPKAFKLLREAKDLKSHSTGRGKISQLQAFMISLAATIGTANIVGVATVIFMGGPGALFWMWCAAIIGMGIKYSEVVLAVYYREKNELGNFVGGPMYVIKNGLGVRWLWLATLFAVAGGLCGFGIGNMAQMSGITEILAISFDIPPMVTIIIMMLSVGVILAGGVYRIAQVAEKLVPFMCIGYIFTTLFILFINIDQVPSAIMLIFTDAFNQNSAGCGLMGTGVMLALRAGVSQAIFSTESGLGTTGIAQSAGVSKNVVHSGMIGMLVPFIGTLIICTLTGLVLLTSEVWGGELRGIDLCMAVFELAIPHYGHDILSFFLVIFAFTTLLGWSYYAERFWGYLLGIQSIIYFRILWVSVIPVGTLISADSIWLLSDTLNGLMAIPNLISLLLLSSVVIKITRGYFNSDRQQ